MAASSCHTMADLHLRDPRRAVKASFSRQISPEEHSIELRKPLPARAASVSNLAESEDGMVLLGRLWRRTLSHAVMQICCNEKKKKQVTQICCIEKKTEEATNTPPPRRWYRVHPTANSTYFVRPDAGLRGRIPGYSKGPDAKPEEERLSPRTGVVKRRGVTEEAPEADLPVRSHRHIQRQLSLPADVERRCGLSVEVVDSFMDDVCKICYDNPSDVVALPCKHGGICGKCLRTHMFSKPRHKGGGTCPICRRSIVEVIQIYREAVFPRAYGYAIKADCFRKLHSDS